MTLEGCEMLMNFSTGENIQAAISSQLTTIYYNKIRLSET